MLRLMYITNATKIAQMVQKYGVDWIFVDLEYIGKDIRQSGRNTVISAHTIEDVKNIRKIVTTSKLMVRVNPLGEWSKKEIDDVVDAGADIIMLPFFKASDEVENFISLVDKRAKTCLLLETMSAVENIDEILTVDGIDFIHIGLNDIHIERKTDFMFEFLADGYIDKLSKKIVVKNIPFGFGGVAHMESNLLPHSKDIIAEHYRLKSSGVILSRSFIGNDNIDDFEEFEIDFKNKVKMLRDVEKIISEENNSFFEKIRENVKRDTYSVRDSIKKAKDAK